MSGRCCIFAHEGVPCKVALARLAEDFGAADARTSPDGLIGKTLLLERPQCIGTYATMPMPACGSMTSRLVKVTKVRTACIRKRTVV